MTLEFLIYAVLLLASASGVVGFHNPIRSGLCLIVNLLTVAAMFASLGAHFLAATQIIVYAGAIVVLVIFVLMLLNVKDEGFSRRDRRVTLAGLIVSLLLLALIVPTVKELGGFFAEPAEISLADGVVAKGAANEGAAVEGTVKELGRAVFTRYVFPFEAASVLIMAALVGAVMLAKRGDGKEA